MDKPTAIILAGPTASGKTDLAVRLVRELDCEIISVDSAMVYRGMDIGTAKPEADVLAQAPHRLIDVRDPAESYSAADFRGDALAAMEEIREAGRIPLLVGGTMLYFRSLLNGLSPLPQADPAVRARLDTELAAKGLAALHARLAGVDPIAARRIHPNDPQRIQRALEVYEITGQSLSAFHEQAGEALPWNTIRIGLEFEDRGVLHDRIERRLAAMFGAGLVDEVDGLFRRGDLHGELPSMRSVGYRQVWRHLAGDVDLDAARSQALYATRQLAKRQMTWMRREVNELTLEATQENLADRVLKYLTKASY